MARFLFVLFMAFYQSTPKAQEVSVGLEVFPPFINADGTGLTVDMFNAIENVSDFKFNVQVMTYARAKNELKHARLDIAGHTPKNLETNAFYQYAQELDWQIETTSDLFTYDRKFFELSNIKEKRIGTSTGNASFFAKQLGVNESYFIEAATLPQLVDMLQKRRIDVLLFERVSVMTIIQQKQIQGIFYHSIGVIPASIAVNKTLKGDVLKKCLDELIQQLDHTLIFSGYIRFLRLPEEGVVPLIKSS